ncbi:MAG: ABC transporter permease [Aigarchaeota archaeon]|nr:ABC transporter permease [Candidatus Pelearchaeum maunauluense]
MKKTNLFLMIFTVFVFIFLYAPMVIMVIFSFNEAKSLGVFTAFSLKWYEKIFTNTEVWVALYNSVWVGAVVTAVSIVLGMMMALAVTRFSFVGKPILDALILIPIIIPEITEALSLLVMYVFLNIPLGPLTVIIGHAAFDVAFVTVVLRARMAGYDRTVEEAARTLGANELQTFFRITLPVMYPAILAAGLLAFTLSFDDLIKTLFTTGPGFKTLPLIVWSSAARGGVSPDLNALSTFAISISLLFAVFRIRAEKKMRGV